MRISIHDFLKLREHLPVADVRSESEFEEGHIPTATNIPVLNNAERVAVGTDYKQKGQAEAIKTGFRLVSPRIPDIVNASAHLASGRELLVHCWRGGLRSSNFCQFLTDAKIETHQLEGGYKSYRHAALESFGSELKLIVIGGYTGSGKSEILRELHKAGEQIIDLEALASHRGSTFGGLMMPPQPTTEQFQNNLFEIIRKLDSSRRVWIEDESIAVGNIFLPEMLWRRLSASPLVEIDVDRSTRVERLVKEYGDADKSEFIHAMERITKKLGGQHFIAAKKNWLEEKKAATIDILLTYYDKAYRNGLHQKIGRTKLRTAWNGSDLKSITRELIQSNIHGTD